MANRSDYTITTLSESVQQRDFAAGVNGTQAPFLFGGPLGPPNLRGRNTAYVSAEGNPVAPRPPQPPLTVNLSKISVSTTAYSATAENYQFLVNLDKISVGTTAYSASAENVIEYISPFVYADFETSSSTTVTVTGSQSAYSGTFATNGGKLPAYDGTNVFRGNYSLDFGNINGSGDTGWVSFGYAPDRPEWGNLFSESFSVSTWIRPTEVAANWQYDGIFWFRARAPDSPTAYNWLLVLGTNADSNTNGSLGWYVTGSDLDAWNWFPSASVPIVQNQWNHIVYAISGNISGNRSITAYINGNQLGTPYRSGGFPTGFSNKNNTGSNFQIGLGSWFDNNYNFKGQMDDLSVWDIELNSAQVNALYNGGSGVDVLTALTQST